MKINGSRMGLNFLTRVALVYGCLFFYFGTLTGWAAPYFGQPFYFQQPDGEGITVFLWGDEFFAYGETADGYMVTKDPKSGYFCYAKVKPDGSDIISTGVRVGRAKPPGLVPKQRLPQDVAKAKHKSRRDLLGFDERGRMVNREELEAELLQRAASEDEGVEGEMPIVLAPPAAPTINNRVSLVLLASFPDRPGDVTKTQSEIDNFCNATGYTDGGNAASIRGYFLKQSNNRFDYCSVVTAWFTAANPRDYYTKNQGVSFGTQARWLITEGLEALKADGFDFTLCDGDGNGDLDGINCFYAGAVVNAWADNFGLWPHSSGSTWSTLSGTELTSAYSKYQITALGSSLVIGTWCHENGHMICNLPDLYSYNGNAANFGQYSLMAGGNYGDDQRHPTSIDSYLKMHAGWLDIVDLNSSSHQRCVVQVDGNQVYRFKNPSVPKEYFTFEVRDNTGYEGSYGGSTVPVNPGTGLVVYHNKEDGSNTYGSIVTTNNPNCNYNTPYEAMVVEADPNGTTIPWYDDPTPDSSDAFKSSGISQISDTTTPNLKFWDATGRNTSGSIDVHSISADHAVMTFVIGSGSPVGTASVGLSRKTMRVVCNYGGTAASQTFAICNAQSGTLNYNVSDNVTWLSCNVASGSSTTEADLVTVSFQTASLSAGSYVGTITVDNGGSSIETITVNLTVYSQPTMLLAPTTITATGQVGARGPQKSFQIGNSSGGGEFTYTITHSQAWLTVSPTTGSVIGERDTIYLNFDATFLARGTYNDTITITSPEASDSPRTIPVTFTVDGTDIVLTAPNGGEYFPLGATTTITWLSPLSDNVKIELLSNGVAVSVIASSTPNNGSYTWTIPADTVLSSNYSIRVTSLSDPSKFDTGNAKFTISEKLSFYQQPLTTNPGWTLGSTWAYGAPTGGTTPRPTAGFTGANVLGDNLTGNYEDNLSAVSYATTTAIDCSNYGNVQLSFYRWLCIEISVYDHATVWVSKNNTDWTEIWHNPSETDTFDSAWTLVTYDISAIADGQPTVYIRWGIGPSDNMYNYAGWHIDDVMLTGFRTVFNDTVLTLNLVANTVSEAAGNGATTGTVSRMGTSGDLVVSLASGNTSKITVPASVTIPNGQTISPPFNINAVNNLVIESTQTVTITATATGYQPAIANIDVIDNDNTLPTVYAGPDQTVVLTGSSWSPIQLSPGLWLDAADDATITTNGATISQWNDKSGFSRNATALSTAQPTATPAGLNGKRVVTFDGSTDVLNVDLDFLAGVSHSTFIVTKPVNFSNIYGAANGSAGANSLHVGFSSATNYRMNYWGNDYEPVLTANFVVGSANIMNYIWASGASKQMLANGKSEGTNPSAGIIGPMSGGGRIGHTTGHPYFGGVIAEIILATNTVSLTDRQKVEGYLAHKWGITAHLDTAHPYKTDGPNNAQAVAKLNGTVSDDDGHTLATTWTIISGPSSVTLGDGNGVDTTATFTVTGVYTLRLTANDGFTQVYDDVVITVSTNALPSTLVAPSGLNAIATATNRINLFWTDNSSNETSFVVQRSLTSGTGFATLGTTSANVTNYTDSTVAPGTTYHYCVSAINANTNSAPSAEASSTTPKMSVTVTTLPTAASITLGQAFSNATLTGGSASVGGSFGYVSPATVPQAGVTNVAVRFTPTDSLNYQSVTVAVVVTVIDIYGMPFFEPFDARIEAPLQGQYGWLADGTVVQTNKTYGGSTKAAQISGVGGYLKHTFSDGQTKVWVDLRVQVVQCPEKPTPEAGSTAVFYVWTNAMVMAFNGTNAQPTGITVAQGAWIRFTMFNDYTTKRYVLYVDDRLAGKYDFYNATVTNFAAIKVSGLATFVDNVGVTPSQPLMKYMPSLILLQ